MKVNGSSLERFHAHALAPYFVTAAAAGSHASSRRSPRNGFATQLMITIEKRPSNGRIGGSAL
jgi:hypothetical protein